MSAAAFQLNEAGHKNFTIRGQNIYGRDYVISYLQFQENSSMT